MHRAAFAVTESVLFAGQLKQHCLDLAPFSDAVAMATMGTRDVVLVGHIETGRYRDRFLIAIDMDKSG